MPKPMTTRERVVRTMERQETDRVPVYELLRNDAAFEHFSGESLSVCEMAHSVLNRPAVRRRHRRPLAGRECLEELIEVLLFRYQV